MQSLIDTVANLMREEDLPALMIGGHAVTALGHPRPNASEPLSVASIELPTGEGPKPHPPRFIDPRIVEAHFAPLMKLNPPSAAERWAKKKDATPFTL